MLDLKFIRENIEVVKKGIASKNYDPSLVDQVLKIDEEKRKLQVEIENLRAERNRVAKEKNIEKGKEIKEKLQKHEPELTKLETELTQLLYKIPNLPSPQTHVGKDESENKVIRSWGEPKQFDFKVKDHMEIGTSLGVIDTETAAKVTGARFGYLKGDVALMEYAIVLYVFEKLMDRNFIETLAKKIDGQLKSNPFIPVVPPVMIKPEIYRRMGRLSDETEIERYHLDRDDLYLIGSAEHTLGPMHMDEILSEKDLPLRYVGFSTSFRREAGSYGKDMKGILRVHQFDKIEMETFCTPETGMNEQELIISIQEELTKGLGIPYQVMEICTGDMGGPDFRQVDINCWLPGQDKYRETHTSDYMTDYQSRRLNTKVRRADGKTEYVHMNDATAFAIGRITIAILENYQNEDGSVTIPEVLRKWMGKEKIEKGNL